MPELPAYANFDPELCLTQGLFRSLRRGDRDRPLDLTWPKADGADEDRSREVLRFRSPALLGVDDLRAMQGVLAFAGRRALRITSARGDDLGRLRSRLKLQGEAEDGDACLVGMNFAELARAVGYGRRGGDGIHGGGIADKLRTSLDRLAELTIHWKVGDASASWQLLSWDDKGPRDRLLRVALNPRTGARALGNPPYARIDLAVARDLASDPARLLHLRLSAWLGKAKAKRIRIDTLAGYPWSRDASGADCSRKRRHRTKDVLDELRRAGWSLEEVGNDADLLLVSCPRSASPDGQRQGSDSALAERPEGGPDDSSTPPADSTGADRKAA